MAERENRMSDTTSHKLPRLLAIILGACGALMLVLGISIYAVTSSQLASQQITVASLNHGSTPNGPNAGKTIKGPFTAISQIQAIEHHMRQAGQTATGGTSDPTTGVVTGGDTGITYGNAPSLSLDAQGNCAATGALWTDPAGLGTVQCTTAGQPPEVTGSINPTALAGVRGTLMNGSFLVSSLYVSVLAFGVSALIGGLGLLFMVVCVMGVKLAVKRENPAAEATD